MRRCVHKKLLIQPNNKNSDQKCPQPVLDQMTETAKEALPSRWNIPKWGVLVALIAIPLSVHSGFWELARGEDLAVVGQPTQSVADDTTLFSSGLLSAQQNPNPQSSRGGAEVVVNDGMLVSSGPVGEDVIAASSKGVTGEISVYTVRANDTLSHIAEMYGVTTNTILWANDIPKATAIQEGQTLVILPVAGVQHVIKKGDTLSSIAKKYDGDVEEIMSYNQVTTDSDLVVGEKLVVPGGIVQAVKAPAVPTKTGGTASALARGWLTSPVPGAIKTQGRHGYNGVDLGTAVGTNVRAAAAGEVIISKNSGWNGGYGQYIVVRHNNGAQTLYAHLSRNDVGVGQYVNQGQVIGGSGNTGRSTGPHLHFEVRGAANPF